MNGIEQRLNAALGHHQAGRLAEAQALYQQILAVDGQQPDALHFLGLLACQVQQYEAGLALMEQSIAVRPEAVYFNNLGNMLREHGRLDEAIGRYRRAVQLKPDYAEAHNNLGNALREARDAQGAMHACAQAIELRPGYAEAYNNLGNALQDMGELDAAVLSYGKAIHFRSDYAQAHSNLGNVLRAQGTVDAAIDSYRQAIALKADLYVAHQGLGLALRARGDLAAAIGSLRIAASDDDATAHNNLASALSDARDLDGAAAHYGRAIELDPDFAIAHSNLSGLLRRQERFTEALRQGLRAVELAPDLAEAHNNVGNAYHGLENLVAAAASYRRALALNANDSGTHHNLSLVLLKLEQPDEALAHCRRSMALCASEPGATLHVNLGDILRAQGDIEGALAAYRAALAVDTDDASRMQTYHRLLFSAAGSASVPPAVFRADALGYGELLAARSAPYVHARRERAANRPLRVGFVSGDLRQHPTGIFLESVLGHIGRERIELIAYATSALEDGITARLRPHFAHWRALHGMSAEQGARRVYEDGVDVLVDLSGHTMFSGLPVFGWKPAPVQASWLGFFATTGVRGIDYFIGDAHTLPEHEAAHFVEQPWRLPDCYLCFTPPPYDVPVGPLPMLSNGGVTYGCFGKLLKIGENVVALWSRLLHAQPGARLMIKAQGLEVAGTREATAARFARHGIGSERLILEGASPRREYFAAYNRIDIALSPFPYPGGTTTAEALWMGVPVLGMKGERFVTHICESLLHNAGLGDWVAGGEEAYLAKALAFAGDAASLQTLRATLRERLLASPLCDARRFARNLEAAFEGMWQRYASDNMGAA